MKGWKTWTAALASIAYGAAGYYLKLHGPDVAVGFVTGGFALVGIGHKIEKVGDLLKILGPKPPTGT